MFIIYYDQIKKYLIMICEFQNKITLFLVFFCKFILSKANYSNETLLDYFYEGELQSLSTLPLEKLIQIKASIDRTITLTSKFLE